MWISKQTKSDVYELDEMYWFIERKERTGTKENVYVISMVSRVPRQIVGFSASGDKSSKTIQKIVESAPIAGVYSTDGYVGYLDTDFFGGNHIRNMRDKSDTHTVESVNADIRHYIPVFRRRSRCFARKLETLDAVLAIFIDAYNRFGEAKMKYRQRRKAGEIPFGVVDFF